MQKGACSGATPGTRSLFWFTPKFYAGTRAQSWASQPVPGTTAEPRTAYGVLLCIGFGAMLQEEHEPARRWIAGNYYL